MNIFITVYLLIGLAMTLFGFFVSKEHNEPFKGSDLVYSLLLWPIPVFAMIAVAVEEWKNSR